MNTLLCNPFMFANESELAGFGTVIESLEELLMYEQNTVLFGVKGSGKTTILQHLFNNRVSYAKGMKNSSGKLRRPLLIQVELTDLRSKNVWALFSTQLRNSVPPILEELDDEYAKKALKDWCMPEKDNKERFPFEQALKSLKDHGFTVVFLMDHFQYFCDPKYADQHEDLRSVLSSNTLKVIAATDEGLDKLSLPEAIRGSYLIHSLSSNAVTVRGLSQEELKAYVERTCELESSGVYFSPALTRAIYGQTGGVFPLVKKMAELCYKKLLEGIPGNPEEAKHFCEQQAEQDGFLSTVCAAVLSAMSAEMRSWCKFITSDSAELNRYWAELQVMKPFWSREDWDNHPIPAPKAADDANLAEAIQRLTQRGIFWVDENDDGDVYAFNSPMLQVCMKQWWCEQKESIFTALKTGPLRDSLSKIKVWLGKSDPEGDLLSQFLDEFYASLTDSDKRSLDEKFEAAIKHSGRPISQEWMDEMELEEKPQYYLKMAIVEEDRAKEGRHELVEHDDCSSITNLYGKALEAHLTNVFAKRLSITVTPITIGVVNTALRENVYVLTSRCKGIREKGSSLPEEMEDKTWWSSLYKHIDKVGTIRNRGDHGNMEPPKKEELERMVDLLCSKSDSQPGIFEKCKLAAQVFRDQDELGETASFSPAKPKEGSKQDSNTQEARPRLPRTPVQVIPKERGTTKKNIRGILPYSETTLTFLQTLPLPKSESWTQSKHWASVGGWPVTISVAAFNDCLAQRRAAMSTGLPLGKRLEVDRQKLIELSPLIDVFLERWDEHGSCFIVNAFCDPLGLPGEAFFSVSDP